MAKKLFTAVSISGNNGMDVIHESSSLAAVTKELEDYVEENLDVAESLFILEFDGKDLKVVKSGKAFSGIQWKK